MFFSFKKAFTPPKGRSPGESFLRFMLLISVFVLAGWLYTVHFNHTLDIIQSRTTVNDRTKTLATDQKSAFRDFAKALKDEFGLELKLAFTTEPPQPPVLDNKTIYFGLDVVHHTVDISIPPLVERALGPGYVDMLKKRHFAPAFEQDAWARATAEALADIWKRLLAVKANPSGPAPPHPGEAALPEAGRGSVSGSVPPPAAEPPSDTSPGASPGATTETTPETTDGQ